MVALSTGQLMSSSSLLLLAVILVPATGDERSLTSSTELLGKSPEDKWEEKRRWGDKGMRLWGKRADVEEEDGQDLEKREWSKNNLRTWGKRDDDEDDKRAWGKTGLRVWGKRAEEKEEEKRKWGDNKMRVWGKRNPGENKRGWDKSSLRAWGKREWENAEDEMEEKRAWNNRLRAWGKRSEGGGGEEEEHQSVESPLSEVDEAKSDDDDKIVKEKRSAMRLKEAIEKSPRVKRSSSWNSDLNAFRNRMNYYPPEGPKRSWRTNVIRVWGKRAAF